jgi:uncharacterized protein involved in exopolysaccharide biosynthesis
LYQEEKEAAEDLNLTDLFKQNLVIENIVSESGNNKKTRPTTIAFKITFFDKNAEKAQAVSNDLVTLFLEENVKARTEMAEETTIFFAAEALKIKQSIRLIENKLREFKLNNSESLPEYMTLNMSLLERNETAYQKNLDDIDAIKHKIIFLKSEIRMFSSSTGAGSIPAVAYKINALEEQLNQLKSAYSSKHPSVIRIQAQLEQLKKLGDAGGNPQLMKAQDEYTVLLSKYSKNHPSVIKKRKELDELKSMDTYSNIVPSGNSESFRLKSQMIKLRSDLYAAQSELTSLVNNKNDIQVKLDEVEQKILKAPEVELLYKELLRDYDNMQNKYRDIKNKELEARIAQHLEAEKMGDRFVLLEPASLPTKPAKPNRKKLIVALIGFAGALGLGVVYLVEQSNPVVRGEREINNIVGDFPLVVVPYIKTTEDVNKKSARSRMFLLAILGFIALGLLFMHLFVIPVDVLWYTVLQKSGE